MDYSHFDDFITKIQGEVYAQPFSEGHYNAMKDVVDNWVDKLDPKVENILDMGCGQGEMLEYVENKGVKAVGITMGPDFDWITINKPQLTVMNADMHFTIFPDRSFDLVFLRHAAEHSFMPLYLLSEVRRITRTWAIVIVPPPTIGVDGDNHYSVLQRPLWEKLFKLAGFSIIRSEDNVQEVIEMRFLLRKGK